MGSGRRRALSLAGERGSAEPDRGDHAEGGGELRDVALSRLRDRACFVATAREDVTVEPGGEVDVRGQREGSRGQENVSGTGTQRISIQISM